MSTPDLTANVQRFTGFAGRYDAVRPAPPSVLAEILLRLAEVDRAKLVVDLGCGTGLSTLYWAAHAEEVIGIDPSTDMRQQAETRAASAGFGDRVRFVTGFSGSTGLAEGCADLVTCSQSLHWMDPEPTFAEVARILRPGGVFAAYDCDWPPTCHWEAETAYLETIRHAEEIGRARDSYVGVRRWEKSEHLARIRKSGQFRYAKEILVHSVEEGSAERLIGLSLSQGGVATLLKEGLTEAEIGIDRLREIAHRTLGEGTAPWYWSYRVRLGLR